MEFKFASCWGWNLSGNGATMAPPHILVLMYPGLSHRKMGCEANKRVVLFGKHLPRVRETCGMGDQRRLCRFWINLIEQEFKQTGDIMLVNCRIVQKRNL